MRSGRAWAAGPRCSFRASVVSHLNGLTFLMEVETEGVLLTQCLLRSFFLYFCSSHLSPVGVLNIFVFGLFSSLPLSQLYFNRLCFLFHILRIPRRNTYITEFLFSVVLLFLLFFSPAEVMYKSTTYCKSFQVLFFLEETLTFLIKNLFPVYFFLCVWGNSSQFF